MHVTPLSYVSHPQASPGVVGQSPRCGGHLNTLVRSVQPATRSALRTRVTYNLRLLRYSRWSGGRDCLQPTVKGSHQVIRGSYIRKEEHCVVLPQAFYRQSGMSTVGVPSPRLPRDGGDRASALNSSERDDSEARVPLVAMPSDEVTPKKRSVLLTVCPFILSNEFCERLAFYG